MIIKENEKLDKYTTIKIGGTAQKFYIPESKDDLFQLVNNLSNQKYYILSAGSNVLINDKKIYSNVIYLMNCCKEIIVGENGNFYVGCSVRLQRLILYVNELGYGGIEYLFSVPGSVGGAVAMNAGTGKQQAYCISDYIEYVDVIENGNAKRYSKSECDFEYRNSIFKKSNIIVLGVSFKFKKNTASYFATEREKRIAKSRNRQDSIGYNFGSVFSTCNKFAMGIIKILGLGKKDLVHFSKKTNNWLINMGTATYADTLKVIKNAKLINKIFGTNATLEVVIWE